MRGGHSQLILCAVVLFALLTACFGRFDPDEQGSDSDVDAGQRDGDVDRPARDGDVMSADGDVNRDGEDDACSAQAATTCGEDGHLWWIDCRGEHTTLAQRCGDDAASICVDGQCCETRDETRCDEDDLFWFDSCGNREELALRCSSEAQVCKNDSECCTPRVSRVCLSETARWVDSCGNPDELIRDCVAHDEDCLDGACCVSHSGAECHAGDLYWVDSCGNREELRQECADSYGCTTDSCDPSAAGGPACITVADCAVQECLDHVADCRCRPAAEILSCGTSVAGSLAAGDATTDLFETYGADCSSGGRALDAPEMTYRLHIAGPPAFQQVRVDVVGVCGATEFYAIALDGSFDPCEPDRCVLSQSRTATVCEPVRGSVTSLSFRAYAGIDYWVIIDAEGRSDGSFFLEVVCEG